MQRYTLHAGDCLEHIRTLADASIDAIITDPPYLSTDLSFDESLDWQWLRECLRVVKPNGYLAMFGTVGTLAQAAAVWAMRFSGVWLKPRGALRTASAKKPMSRAELYAVYAHPEHTVSALTWNNVYTSGSPYTRVLRNNGGYARGGRDQIDRANASAWTQDGYTVTNEGRRNQTDVIEAPSKQCMKYSERSTHPTQKPVVLMRTLIEWLTHPGALVYDPFAGSGSTGVACLETGRRFIGCEINPEYYEIARRRLEGALAA